MTKAICNWCATVTDDPGLAGWRHAILRIEGLYDGSLAWLPEKTLHFCGERDCAAQVERVKDFLSELGAHAAREGDHRVTFTTCLGERGVEFYLDLRLGYPGVVDDLRAVGRHFGETSHPRLRRVIEAFEEGQQRADSGQRTAPEREEP